MILALDVGNTNIVIGGFVDEKLAFVSRISTDSEKTEYEYASLITDIMRLEGMSTDKVEGAIISSVVPPLNQIIKDALGKAFGISAFIVGAGLKTGVNLLIDNPLQAGADLVCSTAAAYKYYTTPAVVVDMGTATKISLVDENGAFCGVSIIPGVGISIRALSSNTAQLPQISLDAPKTIIGKNTIDSMQSGLVYGSACMIDAMLERICDEYGKSFTVIATGGISRFIIPHCRTEIEIDENLILKGLYVIFKKNNK